MPGDIPGGLVVKTSLSSAGGVGLILGRGAKTLVKELGQKTKKQTNKQKQIF